MCCAVKEGISEPTTPPLPKKTWNDVLQILGDMKLASNIDYS